MSTPNPTHIIAEGMREVATEGQKGTPGTREDGQLWGAFPNTMTIKDLAAHVVSKLTDAGYSIVANATVEFGLATSEDPFIREDINEQAAYRIAARYPDVNVMTRTRGPWRPAVAAEGGKP